MKLVTCPNCGKPAQKRSLWENKTTRVWHRMYVHSEEQRGAFMFVTEHCMVPEEVDKNPAAAALRSIPSEKRAQASRDNGKKGGRPRKEAK